MSAALTGLLVHLQDERLSSHEAEQRLAERERDWRRRKAKLDAAAAAVILQDYLDGRSRASFRRRRPAPDAAKARSFCSCSSVSSWPAPALWFRQRMVAPYRGFGADEVFVELPPGLERRRASRRGWPRPASCPIR